MIYALIFIFVGTTLATLCGALFGAFVKKLNKEFVTFLVNFALGAMISLIFLEMFGHSMEHTGNYFVDNQGAALGVTLAVIFASGMLFYGLHELLHRLSHHHHHDNDDKESCHDHAHSTDLFNEKSLGYASIIFMVAIFIHNIPEGLALGINFTTASPDEFPISGVINSAILFIHNFIIGFTMCTSFIQANKSNKFAILMTIVSSAPALLLGYVGYFVSSMEVNELFKGIMLAISTGSLIYVLVVELLPQSYYDYKSKYTFIYVTLGLVLNTLLIKLPLFF